MNEIMKSLHARKSTRAFEERPIAPEDKNAILLAAVAAPSPANQQLTPYSISPIKR
jgi:nitroreductase/FMN reductase (NADPH)/FMN reductase [NAD(P)H]